MKVYNTEVFAKEQLERFTSAKPVYADPEFNILLEEKSDSSDEVPKFNLLLQN